MNNKRISFIGGGNMAEAILSGMLAGGLIRAGDLVVADILQERRDWLGSKYGVNVTADNTAAVAGADVVVLAVKPQQALAVLGEMRGALSEAHLLVSICAGLTTQALAAQTAERVVRVMPNLPVLVGRGISAMCEGPGATEQDLDLVQWLFEASGKVGRIPEMKMNEITALSGSGPGYVFAFVEALENTASAMGFAPELARTLAAETVRGAAELAARSGQTPAELRKRVSSEGGTTLAGLAAMEAGGFSAAIAAGVQAARDRAAELGG